MEWIIHLFICFSWRWTDDMDLSWNCHRTQKKAIPKGYILKCSLPEHSIPFATMYTCLIITLLIIQTVSFSSVCFRLGRENELLMCAQCNKKKKHIMMITKISNLNNGTIWDHTGFQKFTKLFSQTKWIQMKPRQKVCNKENKFYSIWDW